MHGRGLMKCPDPLVLRVNNANSTLDQLSLLFMITGTRQQGRSHVLLSAHALDVHSQ